MWWTIVKVGIAAGTPPCMSSNALCRREKSPTMDLPHNSLDPSA
jgi:hypothetical protein